MKKIYYYQTVERREDGILDRYTYYFIRLESITIKVRSLGSVFKGDVSVMRPDIGFLSGLNYFWYKLNLKELLERVCKSGGPNVNYLLERLDNELRKVSEGI